MQNTAEMIKDCLDNGLIRPWDIKKQIDRKLNQDIEIRKYIANYILFVNAIKRKMYVKLQICYVKK